MPFELETDDKQCFASAQKRAVSGRGDDERGQQALEEGQVGKMTAQMKKWPEKIMAQNYQPGFLGKEQKKTKRVTSGKWWLAIHSSVLREKKEHSAK